MRALAILFCVYNASNMQIYCLPLDEPRHGATTQAQFAACQAAAGQFRLPQNATSAQCVDTGGG